MPPSGAPRAMRSASPSLDETKVDYGGKEMMVKAEKNGKKLLLPIDVVTMDEFLDPIDKADVSTVVVDADKIPADREGADIGPKTVALYSDAVKEAKTVVWNGPMGIFENPVLAAKHQGSCPGSGRCGRYDHHRRR